MAPKVHQISRRLDMATPSATRCWGSTGPCAPLATSQRSLSRRPIRDSRISRWTTGTIVDDIGPDDLLIHHFSLGSRASRTAYALPARMMLIYHNITPPEYFLGVHEQLVRQCYHGRRELTGLSHAV